MNHYASPHVSPALFRGVGGGVDGRFTGVWGLFGSRKEPGKRDRGLGTFVEAVKGPYFSGLAHGFRAITGDNFWGDVSPGRQPGAN